MRLSFSKLVAFSLILAAGCGGAAPSQSTTTPHATEAAATPAAVQHKGLQIRLETIFVDDQDKALHFYTDVLGFAKKNDVTNGPYRWLTVTAGDDPNGTELQLAANANPAAKAFQQAMKQQHQPAAMFFTDDVKAEYERLKARGVEFTMPVTDVTFALITQLDDTSGNLIQLTQLR